MHDVLKTHPARHDLFHVIKAPVPDWDDEDFDPIKFEHRIDEALVELCTERIALVQWMWRCRPNDETHRLPRLAGVHNRVAETFYRLREKGKVGHLACFPYFPVSARVAMAHPAQQALIAYYNPLELEMSPVIDYLETNGRGFLAIRPLYAGVLTDRFISHREVPDGHRLAHAKYANAFRARDRLAASLPAADADMTRFAIRFPLLSPHCASVIVGLNSEVQVAEACDHVTAVAPDQDTVNRVRTCMLE